jgi:RNA-directed DNA polymerase
VIESLGGKPPEKPSGFIASITTLPLKLSAPASAIASSAALPSTARTSNSPCAAACANVIERLAQVGLELNLDKTRIVYCKDSNRAGSHEHERFTFLGYTFRPRLARNKTGRKFVSFLPAVSDDAAKEMRRRIKRRRLHLRSGSTLADLAQEINPTVRGWCNYYGGFYPSELRRSLRLIDEYLVRWATRKYKRLRGHHRRARSFLADVARREPTLFAHWHEGRVASGWVMGAR